MQIGHNCAVRYRLQVLSFEEEPVVQGETEATGQLQGSLYLHISDQLVSSKCEPMR